MKTILALFLIFAIVGCGLETAYRTHPEGQTPKDERKK